MANLEQLRLLKGGLPKWNSRRDEEPNILPDLTNANLSYAIGFP